MKSPVTFLTIALLAFAAPAFAADSLSYDDPGMHFKPPDGWTRVELNQEPAGANNDEKRPPAAIYVWHRGQIDQRTIVVNIQPFEGTLDGFESQHESDLRSASDGTFIDKKTKTTLANGMPAFFLKVSSGSELGTFTRRYEYLVYDGTRSIDVAYGGRQGDFDEKDAVAALASLYVVMYPAKRP